MTTCVRDWMKTPVVVVDPDSSVSYALTLMRRRNIHSLIIHIDEAKQIFGILTITDIMEKIIATDRSPAETRVSEIMTAPVVTADPEWTLKECSTTMGEHGFHHMPVADKQGILIGMISATDIFTAAEEIGWGK